MSASNKIAVYLHVTGNTPLPSPDGDRPYPVTPPGSTTPTDIDLAMDADLEKVRSIPSTPAQSEHVTPSCTGNCGAHHLCLAGNLEITEDRPDVRKMIGSEIEAAGRTERILVLGCGPPSLMDDVRDAAAGCIRCEGPTVELHCEQFGW